MKARMEDEQGYTSPKKGKKRRENKMEREWQVILKVEMKREAGRNTVGERTIRMRRLRMTIRKTGEIKINGDNVGDAKIKCAEESNARTSEKDTRRKAGREAKSGRKKRTRSAWQSLNK